MLLSTFLRDRSGRRDIPLSPIVSAEGDGYKALFPEMGAYRTVKPSPVSQSATSLRAALLPKRWPSCQLPVPAS